MASTDQLTELYACLEHHPLLLETLSLTHVVHFIVYSTALKSDILLTQPAQHNPTQPPKHLSRSIHDFLCKVVEVPADSDLVSECWLVFKHLIWSTDIAARLSINPLVHFKEYGHAGGLSEYTIRLMYGVS